MKSNLKVFFAVIAIAQALIMLNLKADEIFAIDNSHILACKDCK